VIRIAKPANGNGPRILRHADSSGPKATEKLKRDYDDGERDFDFKPSIYGAKSVKNALIKAQHGKCAFCESKILHVDFGDVEHFRPKGGWKQAESDDLTQPGYYWLAYEWSNLFLSCAICKQRHKRNVFPLRDPAIRAESHHDDIADEEPVFIDPGAEEPTEFIGFRSEIAYGEDDANRGKSTIESLGLNREVLAEVRRDHLNMVILIKRSIASLEAAREREGSLANDDEALLAELLDTLEECTFAEAPYSSMARAALE